jgi:hypothetical protein
VCSCRIATTGMIGTVLTKPLISANPIRLDAPDHPHHSV